MHPELGPGFDLWVGGGLSTNPMLAQKLGVWVPLDEVADIWEGVASIFRDYGYRRLRSRARLKFLVADWGVEKFREVLENEYLGRSSSATPRRPRPSATATTSACTSRRTVSSTKSGSVHENVVPQMTDGELENLIGLVDTCAGGEVAVGVLCNISGDKPFARLYLSAPEVGSACSCADPVPGSVHGALSSPVQPPPQLQIVV